MRERGEWREKGMQGKTEDERVRGKEGKGEGKEEEGDRVRGRERKGEGNEEQVRE